MFTCVDTFLEFWASTGYVLLHFILVLVVVLGQDAEPRGVTNIRGEVVYQAGGGIG